MSRGSVQRTYDEYQATSELEKEEDADTLSINLPGFKKEQIRVQIDAFGKLKISGERQVSGNRWARYGKDYRIPDNCNAGDIRAKFENGLLKIVMPKFITQAEETPQRPASPPKEKEKNESVDARKITNGSTEKFLKESEKRAEPPIDAQTVKEKEKVIESTNAQKLKEIEKAMAASDAQKLKEKEKAIASADAQKIKEKEKTEAQTPREKEDAIKSTDAQKIKEKQKVVTSVDAQKMKETEKAIESTAAQNLKEKEKAIASADAQKMKEKEDEKAFTAQNIKEKEKVIASVDAQTMKDTEKAIESTAAQKVKEKEKVVTFADAQKIKDKEKAIDDQKTKENEKVIESVDLWKVRNGSIETMDNVLEKKERQSEPTEAQNMETSTEDPSSGESSMPNQLVVNAVVATLVVVAIGLYVAYSSRR